MDGHRFVVGDEVLRVGAFSADDEGRVEAS